MEKRKEEEARADEQFVNLQRYTNPATGEPLVTADQTERYLKLSTPAKQQFISDTLSAVGLGLQQNQERRADQEVVNSIQRLKMDKTRMDRMYPENWAPKISEETRPDGTVVELIQSAPYGGDGRIVRPKPPEPTLGSDPTGTGQYMWNGSTLVPKPAPNNKPTEADVAFKTNTEMVLRGLDELEAAINKEGTFENAYAGDPEVAARLSALPQSIAIQTAKIVDPASVAREGEVEAMKKYIIPTGILANKKQALAAIQQHRQRMRDYMTSREAAKGGEVQTPALGTAAGAQPSIPAAPASTPGKLSPEDQEALDWAHANPQHPDAAEIIKRFNR